MPTDSRDSGYQRSVAVVGAGITGLVAAYELRRQGVNVTLYEAASHAGGCIRTTAADGFIAEHGPNSFVTSPAAEALLSRLGLQREVVEASPTANKRFIVRRGRLQSVPLSPRGLLRTPLLSAHAKLRLITEPFVKAGDADVDESVASFVRRRFGPETLDYGFDPFISGVFAGDPEQLSMSHALPRLFAMEREHGSVFKAVIGGQRAARRARRGEPDAAASTQPVASHPRLISFRHGMGALVGTLEASLAGTLRLQCPVRLLHRNEARWALDAGEARQSHTRSVDAVVLATPTHAMSAMELPAALRQSAVPLEEVEYPPVSTLTLGFRRADIAHALDGFGMLIPSVEHRYMLGALFSSTLFPERAPADHVTITCFVGGTRYPARAREETPALLQHVMYDLRDLLGARGEPVFVKHVLWPRAIPQYNVGYGEVLEAADAMEMSNPGLYLAGNYRHGISVGDCVSSGQRVAQRVAAYLTRAG
ncbi:MAG: protoporphyrinogen oxidase [Gemmatimonas sp.]